MVPLQVDPEVGVNKGSKHFKSTLKCLRGSENGKKKLESILVMTVDRNSLQ